jgi:flavin-dependent thymidylate synthase
VEVKLLSYTPDALDLLLRTKNTRLKHASDPSAWTDAQRAEHLAYMRDTIRSSWEFVDYTFEITGVTRAFTHQLVRTRAGSYAQESQRTVDVSGSGWLNPLLESPHDPEGWAFGPHEWYDKACEESFRTYGELMRAGVPAQDARGVLPTATLTSIIAKFNLRTLSEMAKVRLCSRTQGEYQDVFRAMRQCVIEVHPWVEEHRFIEVHCVAQGTCAFPRYGRTSCKFYRGWMDLDVQKEGLRTLFWTEVKQVAVPVAHGGKTM